MIDSGQKTSLLIPSQFPEFVRDEPAYANFVLFIKAYYEWMEQTGKVTERTKNLLSYKDIDETSSEFLEYFYSDFLSYFPKDILADKVKVAKFAKQMYQAKGTPDSFKFLFRALYNTDVEFFYTKDAVLRASAGKWYVAKSLKLASTDTNFLKTDNLRIFGETTKSIATIEKAIVAGNKIEIFISNIERLFESGEIVRVVDANNQDVLFDGQPLRSKVVGQISQIGINPINRGLGYRPGDPVIVYGGLTANTGVGASAVVSETTSGSLQRVKLETGGYGYRYNPDTTVTLTNAPGAIVTVNGLNPAANGVANVAFVPTDIISLKRYIQIGALDYSFDNIATSNASTSLANAFTFTGFTTYPISSVLVENSGGGITETPFVEAHSLYTTEIDENPADLKNLGILAPIQILSGGEGYEVNDVIQITGGSGYGAYANVTSVNTNGAITSTSYVYNGTVNYALGGFGYRADALPTLSVVSANVAASNASLYVPGILGNGATFSSLLDRTGSITTISITNPGEDYESTPNVSVKVQDIVVTNADIANLPQNGDIIYQGQTSANSSYKATVDSIVGLVPNGDPLQSLYRLRVYNYNSTPNFNLPLKIDSRYISINMSSNYGSINTASRFDSTGLITYGDGTAKASASFLNGLVISSGQYLDTTGHPSSFDVLQSEIYNNFTYEITLEKEIAKYRDTLLNLLHPTGMKVIGRYAMKSNNAYQFITESALDAGHTLGYYTGDPGSYVTMTSDWTNQSNNIVNFYALVGANLENIVLANSTLVMTADTGFRVKSKILTASDGTSNTVVLTDNVWLTYANVAYVTANSGSNVINITSLTGSYDIVNNGNYSNTDYPLKDIIYAGDKILVANNTEQTVSSINYENGTITLSSALANGVNSLMSVQRTFVATDVKIFGPVGIQYFPELSTEDGYIITTEDGNILILG